MRSRYQDFLLHEELNFCRNCASRNVRDFDTSVATADVAWNKHCPRDRLLQLDLLFENRENRSLFSKPLVSPGVPDHSALS